MASEGTPFDSMVVQDGASQKMAQKEATYTVVLQAGRNGELCP